jgi:hypothetical protein
MADRRASVVAWSAGVSAAGAGMAVVLATGRAGWQRVSSVGFAVIAAAAFLILLGAGVHGLVSWARSLSARASPAADPQAQASAGVAVQENEVVGSGRLFGVLGGNLIEHEEGPGRPLAAPPAPSRAKPPVPNPGRTQRNVVRDNGQLFAVHEGDMHLYQLPGERSPESSAAEERGSDERA